MVARLTDGSPLTIEWLNSIIDELDRLRKDMKQGDLAKKEVTYTGNGKDINKIQIEFGSYAVPGEIPADGKRDITWNFKTNFAQAPIVMVTARRKGSHVIPVTVKSVSAKSVVAHCGNPQPASKAGKVYLDYIAIGKSV